MPNCRYCGHPGAYDSGFTVECPNFDCDHYSQAQRNEYIQAKTKWENTQRLLEEYLDEQSTDGDITPVYHWGITTPALITDPED